MTTRRPVDSCAGRGSTVVAWILLWASAATGQQLLWEKTGVKNVTRLLFASGASAQLHRMGDLDGDGWEDLAVFGTDLSGYPQKPTETKVWLLSGKDGRTLRVVGHPPPSWRQFFTITAMDDADGDGVPDYAVTMTEQTAVPGPNAVEVHSGKDDRILWKKERPWRELYGASLAGGLDLDRDGRGDLVVVAGHGPPPHGRIGGIYPGALFAYSSKGKELWRLLGTSKLFVAGWLERMQGDVDRDGVEDLVVGGRDGATGLARVVVVSGRTGAIVLQTGPKRAWRYVQFAAGCGGGDLDGDGTADFMASYGGRDVEVYSGRTGKRIYFWQEKIAGWYGIWLRAADLDQDGVVDVLVGDPRSQIRAGTQWQGSVFAYSGRDGTRMFRLDSTQLRYGSDFGWFVEVLSPPPDSPFPLFVVAEPLHEWYGRPRGGPTYLGRVQVYRGSPPTVRYRGPGCRGTLAMRPRVGMRDRQGLGIRVHVRDAPAGAPCALLLGFSDRLWGGIRLPLRLDPLGFVGCRLDHSVDVVVGARAGGSGRARGYAAVDLPAPLAIPGWGWVTVHGQVLVLGRGASAPGGLSGWLTWEH